MKDKRADLVTAKGKVISLPRGLVISLRSSQGCG